jgi:hypothetical protein
METPLQFKDPIYFYRESQKTDVTDDLISTLQNIEINPLELCNRRCVFCPRSDPKVYPNRKLFMDAMTTSNLSQSLRQLKWRGKLSLSGFGEPLLHPQIFEIVQILSRGLDSNENFEIITNGDLLTSEIARKFIDGGLGRWLVNLYDGPEQIEKFETLFKEAGVTSFLLRHHYLGPDADYGLTLNNRTGLATSIFEPLKETIHRPCHLPFYKMIIDWNGDLILCCNDWGRVSDVSKAKLNVNTTSLKEMWLSEPMKKYRLHLLNGDRSLDACKGCNVNGTLHGGESFQKFKTEYKQ